jgi:LysM repeat protein
MNLLKIFGLVMALHVVGLAAAFIVQGCSMTPKSRASADAPADGSPITEAAPGSNENFEFHGGTPPPSSAPSHGVGSLPPPEATGATMSALSPVGPAPSGSARWSPTRPADPSSFEIDTTPAPPPLPAPTTHTVRSGDSLWKIAKSYGLTVRELQKANPAIKGDAVRPGQVLKLPSNAVAPGGAIAAAPAGGGASITSSLSHSTYSVRSGDSLSKIAARNGTTVAALKQLNNLGTDVIQVGQQLLIPTSSGAAGSASPGTAPGAADAGAGDAPAMSVTVMPGETLGEIAVRFSVTVQEIMSANGISDPRRVRAGQTLRIPSFNPVGAGAVPPANPPPPRVIPPRPDPPPASPPQVEPAPPVVTPPADSDLGPPPDTVPTPIVPVDDPVPRS